MTNMDLSIANKDDSDEFECSECDFRSSDEQEMILHSKKHTNSMLNNLACVSPMLMTDITEENKITKYCIKKENISIRHPCHRDMAGGIVCIKRSLDLENESKSIVKIEAEETKNIVKVEENLEYNSFQEEQNIGEMYRKKLKIKSNNKRNQLHEISDYTIQHSNKNWNIQDEPNTSFYNHTYQDNTEDIFTECGINNHKIPYAKERKMDNKKISKECEIVGKNNDLHFEEATVKEEKTAEEIHNYISCGIEHWIIPVFKYEGENYEDITGNELQNGGIFGSGTSDKGSFFSGKSLLHENKPLFDTAACTSGFGNIANGGILGTKSTAMNFFGQTSIIPSTGISFTQTQNQARPGDSSIQLTNDERCLTQAEKASLIARGLEKISIKQLETLVMHHLPYLKRVTRGEEGIERHTIYMEGGAAAWCNTSKAIFAPFTKKQLAHVHSILKNHLSYRLNKKVEFKEYLWMVLVPTFLMKLVMDVVNISYEDAELLFKYMAFFKRTNRDSLDLEDRDNSMGMAWEDSNKKLHWRPTFDAIWPMTFPTSRNGTIALQNELDKVVQDIKEFI